MSYTEAFTGDDRTGMYGATYARNIAEARRATVSFFARHAGFTGGGRVLDAGCGRGYTSRFLARKWQLQMTGIDTNPDLIAAAKQNAEKESRDVRGRVTFAVGDMRRTKFAPGTFDTYMAIDSLPWAGRRTAVLEEAVRILRPYGRFIASDINIAPHAAGDARANKLARLLGTARLLTREHAVAEFRLAQINLKSDLDYTEHLIAHYAALQKAIKAGKVQARAAYGWRTVHDATRRVEFISNAAAAGLIEWRIYIGESY